MLYIHSINVTAIRSDIGKSCSGNTCANHFKNNFFFWPQHNEIDRQSKKQPLSSKTYPGTTLGLIFFCSILTFKQNLNIRQGHSVSMKYQDKNKTFGNHVWTQTKQAKLQEQPKWPDIPLFWVTTTSGKEMATQPSILAWKILWTEEPGGLQSMGLQRVRCAWVTELSRADFN